MKAPKSSPLDEANTPSLDAFFDREPEDLTDEELDQLIAAMRAKRAEFDAKEERRQAKKEAKENEDAA